MDRPVFNELAAVRWRQRWTCAMRSAVWGVAAGALISIIVQLSRWLAGASIPANVAWAALVAGPLVGGLIGFLRRQSWQTAAVAVDGHYRLKDRALTALAFVTRPGSTPWSELQIDDALRHLAAVEPRQVVPLRAPRAWPCAVGALLVAVALIIFPNGAPTVEAGPAEPLAAIVAEAEKIEEDLQKLAEIARREQDKELENLVEELREKVEEMKQPGVDTRKALAKLSEMQAALQTQAAQYNVAAVDAQLQSLGNALQLADSMQDAGKAAAEGKYEKAAEELDKLDNPKLDRREGRALEEKLRALADEMAKIGMGSLSNAVSKMCEGCKGDGEKMKEGLRCLAGECRGQGQRKAIGALLCSECDKLGECKCNCQKNSFAKGKKPQKSTDPSTNFGMGTSGNELGDRTNLAAHMKSENITGQQGDGESEIETTHSLEGRQEATRSYRDVYQQYRKLSESVLDSEPIPLGHRQTIRKYFELIRPQHSDDPATTISTEHANPQK